MRSFVKVKILTKMCNHCLLLMKVNHVIVANCYVANRSSNDIRENFRIYSMNTAYTVQRRCRLKTYNKRKILCQPGKFAPKCAIGMTSPACSSAMAEYTFGTSDWNDKNE